MPGDEWQRFANVRVFLSYMWAHPGKKLLFMGTELGQTREWNYQSQIAWELLQYPVHKGVQQLVQDLNAMYRAEPALHEVDFHWEGFEWVDFHDIDHSVIAFLRCSAGRRSVVLWVCNFTPVAHRDYRLGVPLAGTYQEFFNSDATRYAGSGVHNGFPIESRAAHHGKPHEITLTIPPLAVVALRYTPPPPPPAELPATTEPAPPRSA